MLVIETPESQSASDSFEGSTGELAFIVRADTGESTQDVRRYMRTYTDDTIPAPESDAAPYRRATITVTPVPDGIGIYKVTVRYTQLKPQQFSGQTGGGTQRMTTSLETTSFGPIDAPDFKGGINVTKHNVEGVDIVVPRLTFKISQTRLSEYVTDEFLNLIEELTGTTNQDEITLIVNGRERTYRPEELLLLGVDFNTSQSGEWWGFDFTFAVSKTNAEAFYVGATYSGGTRVAGTGILVIAGEKRGWNYLWVSYKEDTDTTANVKTLVPQGVYIERVYYRKAFDDLELNEDFTQ